MNDAPAWILGILGLFGGGTLVGFYRAVFIDKKKSEAEEENIRINTLDHVVQTLARRVDDLTKEVGRLEGRLDRTEAERDYWRSYAQQLITFVRDVARMEVPHPVQPIDEIDGP